MDFLFIKFVDGSVWKISKSVIADSRATYYACTIDKQPYKSDAWKVEYECGLSDKNELIDWMQNNMDWDELDAQKVSENPLLASEMFASGEYHIE